MDIVFVRHGKTEINEKGRYGGFIDTPLSLSGIEEVKTTAKFIQGKDFESIYISPLKRALQTAEILGVNGKSDQRIKEMNFGIFEGLNYQEILKKYPKEAQKWAKDYINYRIPCGESLKDVYERVSDFLLDISKNEGIVLIVTHEGVIKCALCSIFGNPEYFYRFKAAHCRFTQIALEEGYKYIKTLNASEIY